MHSSNPQSPVPPKDYKETGYPQTLSSSVGPLDPLKIQPNAQLKASPPSISTWIQGRVARATHGDLFTSACPASNQWRIQAMGCWSCSPGLIYKLPVYFHLLWSANQPTMLQINHCISCLDQFLLKQPWPSYNFGSAPVSNTNCQHATES